MPGFGLHRVEWMDEPAPHQLAPETVHDRAGDAAVLGMGHEGGELLESFAFRRRRIDLADLGEEPRRFGRLAGGYIAAMDQKRFVRVDRGQSIGFVELPAINEAVVARGALHVDPEEGLRKTLGELDRQGLARADVAAPLDPLDEPFALGRGRGDQLAHHHVEGTVLLQRVVKPAAHLGAAAGDEAGAGVVVAEEVVPESEPVIGVVEVAGEEGINEFGAFVRVFVRKKGARFFRSREQADEIEVDAAEEGGVVRGIGPGEFPLREVGVDEAVDGIFPGVGDRWQLRMTRLQRRFVGGFAEGEAGLPLHALVDPGPEDGDRFGRDGILLFLRRRHPQIGIGLGDELEEIGFRRLARGRRFVLKEKLARVEREAALGLFATVACGAMLLQDRDDLVDEIDLGLNEHGGHADDEGGKNGADHGAL